MRHVDELDRLFPAGYRNRRDGCQSAGTAGNAGGHGTPASRISNHKGDNAIRKGIGGWANLGIKISHQHPRRCLFPPSVFAKAR
jgi:hypothetical protein